MHSISQNVIKHKVGLLNLAAEFDNVSRACKVIGFSRESFTASLIACMAVGFRPRHHINIKQNADKPITLDK